MARVPVVWAPQPGSQTRFLTCPLPECLYHGPRGNGKTDALLFSFGRHVGLGFGRHWRGVLFRRTYPELQDIIEKSHRWFPRVFPGAKFNQQRSEWRFPDGEALLFRPMAHPRDYSSFHGHEFPWIGFEELTRWPDDRCFRLMISCNRSTGPAEMPRIMRATTNPDGVGHNWVKDRYRLHGQWRKTVYIKDGRDEHGKPERPRAAVHGQLSENKILLALQPNYADTIAAAATNKAQLEAWTEGDWDIIAGGMFSDVWSPAHNDVPPFEIPASWRIDRAFDWGSSKPFSVGWWAQSDGSPYVTLAGEMRHTVRGDLFRIAEWYGCTGKPNEGLRMLAVDIAKGIREREEAMRLHRVRPGVADSSIFTVENGGSIALDMQKPVKVAGSMRPGIDWLPANKKPGSRVQGWEQMRRMIRDGQPTEPGLPRENRGLFVVGARCTDWLRTVLPLPRDEKNPDDVDTDAEDHSADETRYRVMATAAASKSRSTVGHY